MSWGDDVAWPSGPSRSFDGERLPNVRREPAMTAARASELPTNKTRWWVRREPQGQGERFVPIPRTPATKPLEVALDPGTYTIGAGEIEDHREEVRVGPDGREVEKRIPCITLGCSSVLVVRGPLTACDPFAVDPPAERLCVDCQEARS